MPREQRFIEVVDTLKPLDDAQSRLALEVAYYVLRPFEDAAGASLRVIELDPGVEQPHLFVGKFLDQVPERGAGMERRSCGVRGEESGELCVVCQLRLKNPHYAGRKSSHLPEMAVYKLSRSIENGTGW